MADTRDTVKFHSFAAKPSVPTVALVDSPSSFS